MNSIWFDQLQEKLKLWHTQHPSATNAEIQAEAKQIEETMELEEPKYIDPVEAEAIKISQRERTKYAHVLAKARIQARLRAGKEMLRWCK